MANNIYNPGEPLHTCTYIRSCEVSSLDGLGVFSLCTPPLPFLHITLRMYMYVSASCSASCYHHRFH